MKRELYDPSWTAEQVVAVNETAALCKALTHDLLSGADKSTYWNHMRRVAKTIRRFTETSKTLYRFVLTNQELWDYMVKHLFSDFGVSDTTPIHVSHMSVEDICTVYEKFMWEPSESAYGPKPYIYELVIKPGLHQLVTDVVAAVEDPDFFVFFDWLMSVAVREFYWMTELRKELREPQNDFLCFAMRYILVLFDVIPRDDMPELAQQPIGLTFITDYNMKQKYGESRQSSKGYIDAKARFLKQFHAFYDFYRSPDSLFKRITLYAAFRRVFRDRIDSLQEPDVTDSTIVPLLELPETYRLFWFLVTTEAHSIDYATEHNPWRHVMFHASTLGNPSRPEPVALSVATLMRQLSMPKEVVATVGNVEFAVESVPPLGSVARERHLTQIQFIHLTEGRLLVELFEDEAMPDRVTWTRELSRRRGKEDVVIIPAGVDHRLSNPNADRGTKFYTLYAETQ